MNFSIMKQNFFQTILFNNTLKLYLRDLKYKYYDYFFLENLMNLNYIHVVIKLIIINKYVNTITVYF